jgi:threonine synthase
MKFVSTNGKSEEATFFEAMRSGLAPDGGLYMPKVIPDLSNHFRQPAHDLSFKQIAFEMAQPFLVNELDESVIKSITDDAFNFPLSLKQIEPEVYILELFHGPTLAFKDFGARFMARLFSEKAEKEGGKVTILVATSGDTGSAVANGFYNVKGVDVCILYPKGKVSPLQEKQMTTLGGNITALEIEGVFDDCQRLVKEAFVDAELNRVMNLSSANSINIARLLPQAFYYAFAYNELKNAGEADPVFSVPSGNFGNLTGGLLAKKMGMPVNHFLAATNRNDVVPRYLHGDQFSTKPSVQTISNAMDVGNPSNFVRMQYLYNHSDEALRNDVTGYSYSDELTKETILEVYERAGYLMCPHTAIGYRAAAEYRMSNRKRAISVILATAHPVKFRNVIEPVINESIEIPENLKKTLQKNKKSIQLGAGYNEFKSFLLTSL